MDQLIQLFFKHKWSIFAKGQFGFANRPSWIWIALGAAALGSLIYFLYIRPGYRINSKAKFGLIGLRVALLALLLILLMRPVIVVPSIIPKSASVAVIVDDSRSMRLADENGRSRIDAAKEVLAPGHQFARGLDEKFKVSLYGLSSGATKIKDAGELKAEGAVTDIVNALRETVNDQSGSSLSAIVLLSDGGANTSRDLGAELRELRAKNIPVFTIGVGNPSRFKDAEMSRVTTPRRVLTGSAVIAEALVRLNGYDSNKVIVAISEDGRALKTQTLEVKGGEAETLTIEFTPSSPGSHRYTFEVKPLEGEMTTENNAQDTLIEVTNDRPKILYIEGEPRWEYGFMRKALAKNEKNLILVSSLRSADGKFYRQGVESGSELATGFPTTDEELFGYQGVVIGSVEANFFSYDQLKNIEQFAARRGGGVLMLGGARSFDAGKYANTPIADLSPLSLNDQVEEYETQVVSNFKASLTPRGRAHAVTRLNEDRALSAKAWEELPPISIPELLTVAKPGATVILEANAAGATGDGRRTAPLLVEERYGRGRSMALTANDTWRWRMETPSQNNSHETFWRQLLRYLVSAAPRQYEVAAERDVYTMGDPVTLRGEVNDKKFNAVIDSQVVARVTKPSGATAEIPLKINFGERQNSADYRNEFTPDENGLYKIEMTARRGGATLGDAQSTFLITDRTREFHDAAQNVELLKRASAETGGKYFPMSEAGDLLDEITLLEGKNSERVSKDLWDMPINFLLLVGLAGAEWFLRKRKGLA
ncbi:MAG TPA: glutamine amidotransferase [Blastocatellia bacterium]|nr:glutamine amidotransferase [Blastocatellia bacterium]